MPRFWVSSLLNLSTRRRDRNGGMVSGETGFIDTQGEQPVGESRLIRACSIRFLYVKPIYLNRTSIVLNSRCVVPCQAEFVSPEKFGRTLIHPPSLKWPL